MPATGRQDDDQDAEGDAGRDAETSPDRPADPPARGIRIGAIAALLLVAGLATWLIVARTGAPSDAAATATPPATASAVAVEAFGPVLMQPPEVRTVPARVGHPVYWAGAPRQGQQLEVTVKADGATYVRYLRAGDRLATTTPRLTMVTYAQSDGYELAQTGAARPDAVTARDSGGALVVAPSASSTSAFFAFKGVPLLVEVFHPDPGTAFTLVQSGRVQMVS